MRVAQNVSPLDPEAFCRSIELALSCPPDAEGSIQRIQKALNRLPNGVLYASDRGSKVDFFTVVHGKQKYLSKKSDEIHPLARRKYQTMLLEILQLSGSKREVDVKRRSELISKMQSFIMICSKGNLDLDRIILTNDQCKWFKGHFNQKRIDSDSPFKSNGGVPNRSKSERDILNGLESLAIPVHYEEELVIHVQPFVDKLDEELRQSGFAHAGWCLYSFYGGCIHWNVPPELEWMNKAGSIWNTYSPEDGTIIIYNDFKIMLANGVIIIWEHEGMMLLFTYRINASERGAIMKYTGTVDKEHFIETYEHDIDTPEKVIDIIERCILPRLWF